MSAKKVIALLHDDSTSKSQHFFHLFLNPGNNPDLMRGTFEGKYVQLESHNFQSTHITAKSNPILVPNKANWWVSKAVFNCSVL
jgi:hypothetical protein